MDPELLELLVCPDCRQAVREDLSSGLVCSGCERSFPVVDGVPVLLPS
jgi:uncharacterized protein YbaR (Trm112 family)